jgi:hypothetical protein
MPDYSENPREEVKEGMREKASTGVYPWRAPFGEGLDSAETAERAMDARRVFELANKVHPLYFSQRKCRNGQAAQNAEFHGKFLLMAPGEDCSGTVGFRCVMASK